ncbi:hypothetical protein HanIR_Chr07g0341221 [Helianthus annuus]|nr:hypothetical protein HanIR_Chr07g0341221 [Helianthus annuus]
MLNHRMDIGTDTSINNKMVLCKQRPRRVCLFAPKACPQMGSIPIANPDKTEYPVMLANPMANEPPASASSPRWPKKSMEIIEREYNKRPVRIMGMAIFAIEMASLIAKVR